MKTSLYLSYFCDENSDRTNTFVGADDMFSGL